MVLMLMLAPEPSLNFWPSVQPWRNIRTLQSGALSEVIVVQRAKVRRHYHRRPVVPREVRPRVSEKAGVMSLSDVLIASRPVSTDMAEQRQQRRKPKGNVEEPHAHRLVSPSSQRSARPLLPQAYPQGKLPRPLGRPVKRILDIRGNRFTCSLVQTGLPYVVQCHSPPLSCDAASAELHSIAYAVTPALGKDEADDAISRICPLLGGTSIPLRRCNLGPSSVPIRLALVSPLVAGSLANSIHV